MELHEEINEMLVFFPVLPKAVHVEFMLGLEADACFATITRFFAVSTSKVFGSPRALHSGQMVGSRKKAILTIVVRHQGQSIY